MVIKKMTSLSEYAKSVEKPKNQKIMKNMAWILHNAIGVCCWYGK